MIRRDPVPLTCERTALYTGNDMQSGPLLSALFADEKDHFPRDLRFFQLPAEPFHVFIDQAPLTVSHLMLAGQVFSRERDHDRFTGRLIQKLRLQPFFLDSKRWASLKKKAASASAAGGSRRISLTSARGCMP